MSSYKRSLNSLPKGRPDAITSSLVPASQLQSALSLLCHFNYDIIATATTFEYANSTEHTAARYCPFFIQIAYKRCYIRLMLST